MAKYISICEGSDWFLLELESLVSIVGNDDMCTLTFNLTTDQHDFLKLKYPNKKDIAEERDRLLEFIRSDNTLLKMGAQH